MCDIFKVKLQQTTHALGILAYNQRLLIDNTAEDGRYSFFSSKSLLINKNVMI